MPGLEVNPIELHNAFAKTVHGEKLAGEVRFDRYMSGGLSNQEWVGLLGADVNNLEHMRLTLGLAQDFVRTMDACHPGELSSEDRQLLGVAAVSHDWGEAIVTDITYSKKTPEDERREKEAFLHIVSTEMADVPGADLVLRAAHEVVFDQKGTRLGKMFNIVERVGYMRTALRAHVRVDTVKSPDIQNGLRWLVADVLGNNPPHLVRQAADSTPARNYLLAQSGLISAAFEAVEDAIFENYGEEADVKRVAMADSFTAWQEWLAETQAAVAQVG